MHKKFAWLLVLTMCCMSLELAEARIGGRGGGGGMRAGVQNRSAGGGGVSRANVNRQNVERPQRSADAANMQRSQDNRADIQRERSGDVNVDRDIDRDIDVDRNIDVDRDIDVYGGWGGYYYHDPYWGWGTFAAGAAVGAVTAAAVEDDSDTVVVTAPVGSYVSVLPAGCDVTAAGEVTIYDCDGVRYQPFYQDTMLLYRVVS